MARIFSFQIQYRNQSFPTLVSLANSEQSIVCTVHYVKRKLRYIQPGDKLIYCRKYGLQQPGNIPPELSEELNKCFAEWATTSAPINA